jgi:hypothetical protein
MINIKNQLITKKDRTDLQTAKILQFSHPFAILKVYNVAKV